MIEATSRAALVAARIRRLRTARGWTLGQLADAISNTDTPLAVGQLSKVETLKRGLSIDELAAIAFALTTTPEHLMRAGQVCGECGQELPT